ncbi:bifunctional diaminohydroxyphosphoribosylaminopyrimidine deaminase/5-amino-6-(5-phosphoribosylamino)uracil reductase RibD [Aliiroseovarius subalbicans]|uniref:bifunctional diaminohydroxyphosphoribosylaminopyrimidine deaminase/5-amino-6-(5-phosphoribosylamino)uracil reductase RibD n=1 Tax=Aliiroseovarius subalbicans TaxID=2925840 RepID=UPI001F592DEE|nr:bifunctional diaminohydroxyphosphoribosylaminopyrimidine deaminase/5-amino-6-(5-phosphoribosylamino)uracil reductase RibD [uncultured Aliiroseovarius sp.]MCI2398578.1 bifunctional diaminohydroxyphosphoribosylaminopyrimidine deaminase/5-amino-6-(5-phosphoribosylamino)uracil reductase RibD [Aliiroseovarius subalbicans]
MSDTDTRFMKLALSLGRRGQGACWPNPAVGCVLVRGTRVIGRGWTQPGGRPHGEVMALAQAGNATGATAYVTLEPCAHHGQTPPCAQALIDAGVARVVVAHEDPDPRVNGGGIAMLRAAGIEVATGVLKQTAARDHAGFLSRVTRGRPMVTLKLANSFDGRIATATGESQWITGPAARRYVHALRARHDAVMVGGGTARADDPSLTVRGLGVTRQPVRVVLSRHLDLPLDCQLARSAREVPVWLCHGPKADPALVSAWQGLGAETLEIPLSQGRIDMTKLLQALGARGLTRVFSEGGGAVAASLLTAGLVDDLVGITAGLVLGAEGRPSLAAMGIERLATAPRFTLVELRDLGGDVLHHWRASTPQV